jgi:hypothetical protein
MTPSTTPRSLPFAHRAPFEPGDVAEADHAHRAPARGSRRAQPSKPTSGATRRKLGRLGGYTDASGRAREVIARRRCDGCVLVVDRDSRTLGDRRLVACLDADEPVGNASLMCAHYLTDDRRGRCRRVRMDDLIGGSSVGQAREPTPPTACAGRTATELLCRRADGPSCAYRLAPVQLGNPGMELRWCKHSPHEAPVRTAGHEPVRLREVIGALESYEPACELTLAALARYRDDPQTCTAVLRIQLERLRESPIVLNRKLREAVLAAIGGDGPSLSEIALRCGRVKRDRKGNCSGETSWLARRVGILPESGRCRCNPWVHSDVLALIARSGLGISPREVELG